MVFVKKICRYHFFVVPLQRKRKNNKIMNAKNLMFVSIAVLAIVLSACISVFTYNEVNKVKFTCHVKGNDATYYMDFDEKFKGKENIWILSLTKKLQ